MNNTVKVYSEKFLDAKVLYKNSTIKTKLYCTKRMLPVHWSSKIPKR